jgi:hypothetical protein
VQARIPKVPVRISVCLRSDFRRITSRPGDACFFVESYSSSVGPLSSFLDISRSKNGTGAPIELPHFQLYPQIISQSLFDSARAQIAAKLHDGAYTGGNRQNSEADNIFTRLLFDITFRTGSHFALPAVQCDQVT